VQVKYAVLSDSNDPRADLRIEDLRGKPFDDQANNLPNSNIFSPHELKLLSGFKPSEEDMLIFQQIRPSKTLCVVESQMCKHVLTTYLLSVCWMPFVRSYTTSPLRPPTLTHIAQSPVSCSSLCTVGHAGCGLKAICQEEHKFEDYRSNTSVRNLSSFLETQRI
jgi:hypothetical protein